MIKTDGKEHMTFTIDGGTYVGHFTNHPAIIVEAETLEQMIERGNDLLKYYLDFSQRCLENGIDTREVSKEEYITL